MWPRATNHSPHQSQGQDDLWIGQVGTDSKQWGWIRQLGTSQDESLSDLTVDKDGNVIVLGNTDGSFMRRKTSGGTDVFVISLSRERGDYPIPVESGLVPEDGGGSTTPAPTSPSVLSSPAPAPVISPSPVTASTLSTPSISSCVASKLPTTKTLCHGCAEALFDVTSSTARTVFGAPLTVSKHARAAFSHASSSIS